MQYLPERHSKDSSEFEGNSEDKMLIPGVANLVPQQVLPPALFYQDGYDIYVNLAKQFAEAKGILVNTFTDLEPYSEQDHRSVYAVGPLLELKSHTHPEVDLAHQEEVFKWLDDQPEASVVLLCFGSFGGFGAPRVKEIAHALELCGHRFLWSLRPQPPLKEGSDDFLPEGFLDRVNGQGMICGWAPQGRNISP